MKRIFASILALSLLLAPPRSGRAEEVAPVPAVPHAAQVDDHWAYRPITRPVLPVVEAAAWPLTEVDRFVLAKLESVGVKPSPEADRATLIRRLSFDLIGLPPTYEQVLAFVDDPAPDAYERLVDRLLNDPGYGERWGRHWLDVARYSDTMGYNFTSDRRYPFAWTYRDYVVAAFNRDKPYDRFVMEQLAADWMDLADDPQGLAAMGFLTVGRRFDFDIHATIEDRIDVVTRGLMGLTVQCARCHDHKYDPISSADYYALYGVFRSSTEPETKDLPVIATPSEDEPGYKKFLGDLAAREQKIAAFYEEVHKKIQKEARERANDYLQAVAGTLPNTIEVRPQLVTLFRQKLTEAGNPPTPTPEQIAAVAEAVATLDVGSAMGMIQRDEVNQLTTLRNEVQALYIESPGAPARAMVMLDAPSLFAPYVFKRGQAHNVGEPVDRRFLSILTEKVGGASFKEGSGRLELAQAIVHPDNPLTPRVIANRLWQHHFGAPLARTSSDFGSRGEPPTHPELLDYLARTLMDEGWSLKKLHKRILLSATYRQSSALREDLATSDPENRLLARQERRRLDFEPMRDALLAVAGQLDRSVGGRGGELVTPPFMARRSVYGYIDRQFLPQTLRTFDFASPDSSSPGRPQTTVPQQALFFMNSPFLVHHVHQLLARPEVQSVADDRSRLQSLYRLAFARDPSPEESELALTFLAQEHALPQTTEQLNPWAKLTQALLQSNEFVFVD